MWRDDKQIISKFLAMKFQIIAAGLLMMSACSSKQSKTATTTPVDSEVEHVMTFDADSAYYHVENQVAFGPRIPGTNGHKLCVEYIVEKLKEHNADTVMLQKGDVKKYDGEKLEITNIIAQYNKSADKRILLVAHYDTRPWADEDPDEDKHDEPVPGANDGGSGVGVLLELSRLFGQRNPEVGIDMLFVDAEDMGVSGSWSSNDETWCLGTQYWAQNPHYPKDRRPVYGIVLDMVGGNDAVFYRESISDRMAPGVNAKIWSTAARSEYADRFVNEVCGTLIDDHLFVNRAGIPCIDIVECNNAVTNSFPSTWHTTGDDMIEISRRTLRAVGQVVADVIYSEK